MRYLWLTSLAAVTHARQKPLDPGKQELWTQKYGAQGDLGFSGPLSFSHLPYTRCLEQPSTVFDIAILGMPFDTGVSYRPGARFGPFAIRSGSRRQGKLDGYTLNWMRNPYMSEAQLIDCGDVSIHAGMSQNAAEGR